MAKKAKKKNFNWLLALLLLPSLILNFYLLAKQQTQKSDQGILVIGAIDGDTLVLDGKVKLRLRQVDAPELAYCGGNKSKEFLEKLTKGKKITIKEKILDKFGRPIALVYIDNTLVNKEILANGWGRYHNDKTSQKQALKQAYQQAKKNKKGIFSPECFQTENLDNPECVIKGNIDKVTKTKLYYYPGCAQYKYTIVEKDIGENWFCSESQAQKAGFTKSKTCHNKWSQ